MVGDFRNVPHHYNKKNRKMENSKGKNNQESLTKESLIEKDLIAFKKLINDGYAAIGDTFKKGEYKDFCNDKLIENWSTEELIERICSKDI